MCVYVDMRAGARGGASEEGGGDLFAKYSNKHEMHVRNNANYECGFAKVNYITEDVEEANE